jgi:hypothetical protein
LLVNVSVSGFVPKAHTPFQWAVQDDVATFKAKQRLLRDGLKSKKINFSYHDAELSLIEGAFARGDRRLGKVLLLALQKGCRFDGWGQHFHYDKWREAFAEAGFTPEEFAQRNIPLDAKLPWEHIDCGVTKEFLAAEYRKALAEEVTEDCRFADCTLCGVCQDLPVATFLQEDYNKCFSE